jgi:probable rRNA maturation factor
MLEIEILAAPIHSLSLEGSASSSDDEMPSEEEIRELCELAVRSADIQNGHLAIEFVDERRIAELNGRYRERPVPTDVLSFPIDEASLLDGERELGDVVICIAHTADVREAVVHGVLHLVGMDHETDEGEMLALQQELLSRQEASSGRALPGDQP